MIFKFSPMNTGDLFVKSKRKIQNICMIRSSGVISRNYSQEAKDGMHKDLAHGP